MSSRESFTLIRSCLVITMAALVACSEKNEPTVVMEKRQFNPDQIQEIIQKKEYDLAEQQLKLELELNPKNNLARVLWASVYLQRANVTIKDYFLLNDIFSQKIERKDLGFLNSHFLGLIAQNEKSEPVLRLLRDLNETAIDAEILQNQLAQIPLLDSKAAEQVYTALVILEKLETAKPGERLYRGLSKLIYFKYLWQQGLLLQFGEGKFCEQKLSTLDSRLNKIGRFVPLMIEDLSFGVKSAKSMLNLAETMRTALSQARQVIQGLGELTRPVRSAVEGIRAEKIKCDF